MWFTRNLYMKNRNKRVAVFLGHPAQYHLFKLMVAELRDSGKEVLYVIKQKDILQNLLDLENEKYVVIREGRSDSKWGMVKSVLTMEYKMVRFIKKYKIDILIGTTLSFATKYFTKAKVIIAVEDDASVVPQFSKIAYPYAEVVLSPVSCDNGIYEDKSIKYKGYHKLAYLHPNRFTPDINIVKRYINTDKPFFLLRFAKLNAFHDLGANISGMNDQVALKIIKLLEPHGNVYISSERELSGDLKKYKLEINPIHIHHVMAYADIFVGDSQSMAVESAVLGTPSVRFNDFVGKIGVLEELEYKYGLTYGIKSTQPELLYNKIADLLKVDNLKEIMQKRREELLQDKIDVTAFLVWFVGNYPESKTIMNDSADYQNKFK